jgi:hypothetical protein
MVFAGSGSQAKTLSRERPNGLGNRNPVPFRVIDASSASGVLRIAGHWPLRTVRRCFPARQTRGASATVVGDLTGPVHRHRLEGCAAFDVAITRNIPVAVRRGRSGGEIEDQHFGILAVGQRQAGFVGQQGGIAFLQFLAVDREAAAHQMHVSLARRVERQGG